MDKISCRNCHESCSTKDDLDKHIIQKHISYKPCRNFATNSCEYNPCRFSHVMLREGEHRCYKCGDKFTRKFILLNHIKNAHNDICLKFQEGNCTYGSRCVFKHTQAPAQIVVRGAENSIYEALHTDSQQVFQGNPITENRLMGGINTKEQTMFNMNKLINQMSIIMNQMMNQ